MVLKIKGIQKTFKGTDGEPEFSIDLPEQQFGFGKINYLMGPNGSGKSVFIKLIAGELLPTVGHVELSTNNSIWKAHQIPVGVVRQNASDSLANDLSVLENLLIKIHSNSFLDKLFPKRRLYSNIKKKIDFHDELAKKLDQPCINLSGGQRQALAFLSVTLQKSKLLLLDEFLSATDYRTSKFLLEFTKAYSQDTPSCVFIVSHDIQSALENADRILVLKKGRLEFDLVPHCTEWNAESISHMLS